MIAMKFTIELDIGLSYLLQAALPQLVTDRETKTHRRGLSKRSYGHCRRRTEIPEAEGLGQWPRCRPIEDIPRRYKPPGCPAREMAATQADTIDIIPAVSPKTGPVEFPMTEGYMQPRFARISAWCLGAFRLRDRRQPPSTFGF
jgi:hypothetical protein